MFIKTLKPLSLTIAIVSGSFAFTSLAHANGADIINGWIENSKASNIFNLSADDVSYDGASDVTSATNLTLTFTIDPKDFKLKKISESDEPAAKQIFQYQLKMPTITFAALNSNASHYSVAKISSPTIELVFDVDAGKQKIKSTGKYVNFLATDLSWAKIPTIKDDTAKPASKYYPVAKALVDISFSLVKAERMEMVQENLEPKMTTTTVYKDMVYKNASHGDIEFSSISSAIMSAKGEPFTYTANIGPITISDYKFGTLIANFAPDVEPQENAPFKTVTGKAAVGKIDVTFNKGNLSIESITWDDFGVRPAPVSFLPLLDGFIPKLLADKEPTPQDIADLVRSTYGAFRLGKSEIKGVAFDIGGVVGKLDSAILKDLSSDGLGAHIFSGFSIKKVGEFDVSFGNINMLGIKFPALKALLGFEQAQQRNDVPAMLAAIPIIEELSVDDVKVNVAEIGQLSFTHAGYTMSGHIGPIPTKVASKVTDLVLPVSMLDKEIRDDLTALGYETIKLSYADGLNWHETSKTLAISSHLKFSNAGSYQFTATLGGLPKMLFEIPMAAPGILIGATFNDASFKFIDDSIIDRGFKFFAREENTDVETLKTQILSVIPAGLAQLKNPNFTKSVVDAVRNLIDNKGSITATAQPNAPVPLVEIYSTFSTAPETLIDRLNVKVEAR